MKRSLSPILAVVLFALVMGGLFYGAAFCMGSSTDVSTLGTTGTTFTAKYVSEDGRSAVFVSNWGFRRLVEFDRPKAIIVGREYRLKSINPGKLLPTKTCLVPA